MNRKQRRAARRSGGGPAPGFAARRAPAPTLAELYNTALRHHQAGTLAEAERYYRQVLAAAPGHAEAHSRLGAVMMRRGKTTEAIAHIERALELKPDIFEAYGNLSQAYLSTGQQESAIEAACRALELNETAQAKALFAQCVAFARFSTDSSRYRRFMLRALLEGWARPRELAAVSISLIKLNGVVKDCIARAESAWPARLPASELFGTSGMAALAEDQLLCRLLECDPVTDLGLERLLTNIRHAMLTAAADGERDENLLAFYCAVARQCFINEYVFATTAAEIERAEALRTSLEAALAAARPYPSLWPAVVGAYFPLHGIGKSELLLQRSWPQSVGGLLAQQVKEPAQEREIAATMPALTGIDDEVSRAVRRQYEESPYPRWTKAGPPKQFGAIERQSAKAVDILIAGCGTGLSTVELARQARQARILAIDLSLASLGYAKRMAQSLGVANVEFAQADVLNLASIGREFDFIDASGVLHHLADPWQGWRVLLSLLRRGGAMQVGLYSRLARRNIIAARTYIAERGYRSIAEDIRRCRQEIIASNDPLLKSLPHSTDFFATSECRDLLFHVQEHQMTIPDIKSFIGENSLEFGGFIVPPATLKKFAARFPDRAAFADLDCWHAFETDTADTFSAMYLFSVRKPVVTA